MEFYINNKLMHMDDFAPYTYAWIKKPLLGFKRYRIKAVAYDNTGNKADNVIKVWKFPEKVIDLLLILIDHFED